MLVHVSLEHTRSLISPVLVNSETKWRGTRESSAPEKPSRPAVARTQVEMATEHSGQTGVVTVASSQGLEHARGRGARRA